MELERRLEVAEMSRLPQTDAPVDLNTNAKDPILFKLAICITHRYDSCTYSVEVLQ